MKEFRVIKPWVFILLKVLIYTLIAILAIFGLLILSLYTSSEVYIPVFIFLAIAGVVFLTAKFRGEKSGDIGACGGGDSSSGDSDPGHSHHGDGHGGHGCSSGCSGCSGSGCSGCGGGCGGD